ncbi:SpoIIE family protein phosphatase [Streptomyces sp. NPDC002309]
MGAPEPTGGTDGTPAAGGSGDTGGVDALGALVADVGGEAAAALRALLTASVVGLAVWDTDLRCVWVNDALEGIDGIARDRRLGRRPREALSGDAAELDTVAARVLETGVCVTGREYRPATLAGRDRDRVHSASFLRLDDAEGRTLGVCMVTLVIKDRRWAGNRLAMVNEAGARIGTTLDVMRTAQELADFTVPSLADYVTVDLTEAVRLGQEPLDRLGPSQGSLPKFRRAGRASIHAGVPEALWAEGEVVYVPETSPFMRALASGHAVLQPRIDTSAGTWLEQDPERAAKIREFHMHSLLVVPILARGVILGVAVFVRTDTPAPFDETDQLLAEELVSRAALSLDNARRYTRERTAALVLQRSLLPRRLDGGTAMEVAARYLPAAPGDSVGGDWYDVIGLPGGRLALVLGDVVGHGIDAAATMGRLRTSIRTLADLDLPPDELLTRLDRTFIRLTEDEVAAGADVPSMGATCVYAVHDPATSLCTLALAGHPPPAVVRPDGVVSYPDLPHGPPLGVGMLPFPPARIELPAGSVIALYSDGLVEERHQDIDVGMERVARALSRGAPSLEELCTAVVGTLPTPTPADDVTLLLARAL